MILAGKHGMQPWILGIFFNMGSTSFIEVNGQTLYYEIHGVGYPLVLIAGFNCNQSAWSLILRELACHFKVVTFDNRDAGKSSCPDIQYTIEDMADDVADLIDALKLDKPHLLGHSMGGAIAQHVAYKYPNKLSRLILSSTTAHFCTRSMYLQRFVESLMEQGLPREMQISCTLPWVYSNALLANPKAVYQVTQVLLNEPDIQSLPSFKRQSKALEMFDSRSWINCIKHPTLVIYGTEDLLCLNDHVLLLKEIKSSKGFAFEETGHLPHIEQSKQFTLTVINFLS